MYLVTTELEKFSDDVLYRFLIILHKIALKHTTWQIWKSTDSEFRNVIGLHNQVLINRETR